MPSFYAMIAASASSYMISGLLGKSMGAAASAILSSLVWVVIFFALKKWLTDLRP